MPPTSPQSTTPATCRPAAGTGLFPAMQQNVGLKLEAKRGALGVIVIDHLERPTDN